MSEELPGMLAVAKGVAEQKFPHTMDAQVWAREFNEVLKRNGVPPFDPGFLIGWFANAIMAGYDTAQARSVPSETRRSGPYSYERMEGLGGDVDYRVRDSRDNRVATCCLQENAEMVVRALNIAEAINGR